MIDILIYDNLTSTLSAELCSSFFLWLVCPVFHSEHPLTALLTLSPYLLSPTSHRSHSLLTYTFSLTLCHSLTPSLPTYFIPLFLSLYRLSLSSLYVYTLLHSCAATWGKWDCTVFLPRFLQCGSGLCWDEPGRVSKACVYIVVPVERALWTEMFPIVIIIKNK